MSATCLNKLDKLILQSSDQNRAVLVIDVCVGIGLCVESKGPIEGLTPRVGLTILCDGKCVGHAAGDLLDTEDSLDQCGHVALLHPVVVDAKLTVGVAAHGVDVSSLS